MNTLICSIILFSISITNDVAAEFGYEGLEGPDFWGFKYSECIGKHQSPINIEEHDVELTDFLPIRYENFDTKNIFTITNDGHTAKLTLNSQIKPTIIGGPLMAKYEFAQLHFHWGSDPFEGSENKINNISFSMELHIVFYGSSYGSVENATKHRDGLAVLSFLYSLCPEENTNYTEIINSVHQITAVNSTVEIPHPLSLEDLIASDKSSYFTYSGSLTTPPCSEVVTWIEYRETIPFAPQQIQVFRHLNSRHGKLIRNLRPTQPLHGRKVRLNNDITIYPKTIDIRRKHPFPSTLQDLIFYNQFNSDIYV